jgi:hypothetical protein
MDAHSRKSVTVCVYFTYHTTGKCTQGTTVCPAMNERAKTYFLKIENDLKIQKAEKTTYERNSTMCNQDEHRKDNQL